MPRFEMIDRGDLSAFAAFASVIQQLSDNVIEDGMYEDMWDCFETLFEMGVIDRSVFMRLIGDIHEIAEQAQPVIDYIDNTAFYDPD